MDGSTGMQNLGVVYLSRPIAAVTSSRGWSNDQYKV